MIRLIQAELYLIFRQKRTYYGLAAILIIELFIVVAAWFQGNEIIDILLDNLTKNFFIEGNLVNGNLVMYIVLNSLWFNLPLIIMIIVSGFLSNEYKDRTIQTVMLQSVKKMDYITSKYISGIAFTLFVLVFLFLTASALSYGLFGKGDLITYLNSLNFIESHEALGRIVWAFAVGAMLLIFYSIASITFAVIFREITVTWIASALFLILCNLLLKMDLGVLNSWFLPKLIDGWQYFFYFEIPMVEGVDQSAIYVGIHHIIYDNRNTHIYQKGYWMKRLILVFITALLIQNIRAQDVDPLLLEIRQQMEVIAEARGAAELILDVDFIKMPIKYADIHYKKGQPVSYTSDNFIIIPKKGLDFSWSELFRHDFITVNRGMESVDGNTLKVLNIIPLDKKADFAIMTLKLDTQLMHIREAEITTKNEGSYRLLLSYTSSTTFPDQVVVEFELEKIKIPLSFMGKDTEIDKAHLKSDELKKGSITLNLDWQDILVEE